MQGYRLSIALRYKKLVENGNFAIRYYFIAVSDAGSMLCVNISEMER